jgi:cell division protein FtsB
MLKRYKKAVRNYFPRSRIIVIACGVVAIFLTVNLTKEVVNRHQIDQKIKDYESEVKKLERENYEIGGLITSWENGGQLEKEARLKLGLQRPDENTVLILRDDKNLSSGGIINPNSEIFGGLVIVGEDNVPNRKKWWIYFFSKK